MRGRRVGPDRDDRHVPAGLAVEAAVNGGAAVSGTANGEGDATLVFPASTTLDAAGKGEMDANIFLDTCAATHRVIVMDRARTPPAAADGCERREIPGVFWVRRLNTIVVDVSGTAPSLLLIRQDTPPPPPKPDAVADDEEVKKPRTPSPIGPVVFGGGGIGSITDIGVQTCGSVTPCTAKNSGLNYTFGAEFWMKEWLGIDAAYLRPRKFTASGGDTFNFNTDMNTDIWTIAGLVAAPLGRVRVYAKAGVNYSQATSTTVETIALASQTITLKTRGWGYLYGGGTEVWFSKRLAAYGEFDVAKLNGTPQGGGEAKLDDKYTAVVGGVRLRVGR